jgi:hypothetical protein
MHDASPNDRPAAPACAPNLTPLLCSQSQSQWWFLLFPRTPVFSPSMTETLTVLSISSAGVAALTSPGALRAHFPPLLQPLLPKFEETESRPQYDRRAFLPEDSRKISDSQEEKI